MYYPCCEIKGADQLRGYSEADLHLCFCICKNPVFSPHGSFVPLKENKTGTGESSTGDATKDTSASGKSEDAKAEDKKVRLV